MPQNFISEAYKLSDWIRIIHFDIPDEPKYLREACRDLMALNNHCKECTALSGCYFISTKCPNVPQHPRCDCKTEFNYCPTIITYCDIRKFTDYIFADKDKTNRKKHLFESWGFTKQDSEMLKFEFERQAKEKFMKGHYSLGKLDCNCQRVNIKIELSINGIVIDFISGWAVYPNGLIICTTPYGGR